MVCFITRLVGLVRFMDTPIEWYLILAGNLLRWVDTNGASKSGILSGCGGMMCMEDGNWLVMWLF